MGRLRQLYRFVITLWMIIKELKTWIKVIKSIPWKTIFKKRKDTKDESDNNPSANNPSN